jgi:NADPH2:quinone reductase
LTLKPAKGKHGDGFPSAAQEKKMRALLSHAPGKPDTLTIGELPEPTPGPGQIRINVGACALNYPDVLVVQDMYQERPQRPFAPGLECSGIVDAAGPDATAFKPGDRVLCAVRWGGLAERVVVDERMVFAMPEKMNMEQGAALLTTYGTSHYALANRARMRAGETLLVLGASGGVGLAAVELGKAYGGRVIAAASSAEKAEIARQRGADEVLIYPRNPLDTAQSKALGQAIKAATNETLDVVYDAVGGDYAEPALRSLSWAGRYLVIGFAAGVSRIPLNLPLLKGCDIQGIFWGSAIARDNKLFRQTTYDLLAFFEAGKISPMVSEVVPLAEGGAALQRMAERNIVGKVVIKVDA